MVIAAAVAAAAALAAAPAPANATMRAVQAAGQCGPPFSCVTTGHVATPRPGPGQVLIEVKGSSVNPCDYIYVQVGFPVCSGGNGTLGMDVAGVVVEAGEGVTRLRPGDEVWADAGGVEGVTGAYADYAVMGEAQTGLKPRRLSFTDAGTVPLVGFTSLECLQKTGAPWKPNTTVVVTSGSGGTGVMAVQLAKALGAARVITAATGPKVIALMKSLGADVVVDYKVQDIFDAIPEDSVDVVFDNYGHPGTADKAMPSIRAGGTYLILPGGGGDVSKNPKAGVQQINFGTRDATSHAGLDTLSRLFDAGKLRVEVQQVFPLDKVADAFTASAGGQVVGKLAVRP